MFCLQALDRRRLAIDAKEICFVRVRTPVLVRDIQRISKKKKKEPAFVPPVPLEYNGEFFVK
jgi:hypothetical protein